MRSRNKLQNNEANIVKVCVKHKLRNKTLGVELVSETAVISFFESNLWLNLPETVKTLANSKEIQTNQEVKLNNEEQFSQISEIELDQKISLVERIEFATKCNFVLAEYVKNKWEDIPPDIQALIEELAYKQLECRNGSNHWKPFKNKYKLLLIFASLLKGRNLINNYRNSVTAFTDTVLGTVENKQWILSDTDRDIFLDAITNTPELSEDLKLGIRDFRKKYKV